MSSYVRADRLGQAPCFGPTSDDTADLEFLCSQRIYADPQKRSVSKGLVVAATQGELITGTLIDKGSAVEALAHLSFVETLDLDPAERLCVALQFLELCRRTVEKRHAEYAKMFFMQDLEVGLEGLANLARGDSGRPNCLEVTDYVDAPSAVPTFLGGSSPNTSALFRKHFHPYELGRDLPIPSCFVDFSSQSVQEVA